MEALQAYDLGMLYAFERLRRPWLNPVVVRLTHLGDYAVMIGVVVAVAGMFLLLRRPRLGSILILVALLALGVERGAKLVVQRPRPDVAWRLIPLPNEPSFPSGHALCSMAIYGCIGMLAAEVVRGRWRRVVIVAGFGMGVLIGFTRPYLGVHYPLDVLGGWTAGLACALLGGALAVPGRARAGSPETIVPGSPIPGTVVPGSPVQGVDTLPSPVPDVPS
jgi:undecaprenyl-diphosphatase